VQQIVENAKQQKLDMDIDSLIEAFLYYYKCDAFMSFQYNQVASISIHQWLELLVKISN